MAMKTIPRFLRFLLWGLIVVVALGGALFGYFVYSPAPEVPRLSGTLTQGTIEVGGRTRTYLKSANWTIDAGILCLITANYIANREGQ
jgi:hypothetical protein